MNMVPEKGGTARTAWQRKIPMQKRRLLMQRRHRNIGKMQFGLVTLHIKPRAESPENKLPALLIISEAASH
jgi:hypothetical protein